MFFRIKFTSLRWGKPKVYIYLTNAYTCVIKAPSTCRILLSLQNVLLSLFSVSPTHSQGSHSPDFFFFFGHLWLVLPILEIHVSGIDSICLFSFTKYRTCENSHILHLSIDCSFLLPINFHYVKILHILLPL